MDEFIKNFANQFDDTEFTEFSSNTEFRKLDEWSSLIGLAVMNMVEKKYGKKLTVSELRAVSTIKELYDVVVVK